MTTTHVADAVSIILNLKCAAKDAYQQDMITITVADAVPIILDLNSVAKDAY